MKKVFLLSAFFAASISAAWCQAAGGSMATVSTDVALQRLSLATSSLEYPVTPGDLYQLTYLQAAGETIVADVVVDSNYMIDLNIFGRVDARNMTYARLKRNVEDLVFSRYPRSYPSFRIVSTGIFRIAVRGEIPSSRYVTVWGLSRLSDVIAEVNGPNASTRRIEVFARDGSASLYDLLKATRLGLDGQDPLMRPGDSVLLHPSRKVIRLEGEVFNPGSYELADGEGFRDLIEQFGGGLTKSADSSKVKLDKTTEDGLKTVYVSLPDAYFDSIDMSEVDIVSVRSRTDTISVVWFEGALRPQGTAVAQPVAATALPGVAGGALAGAALGAVVGTASAAAAVPAAAGVGSAAGASSEEGARISVSIRGGELLSDVLRRIRDSILPNADLEQAQLFRMGDPVPSAIDLRPLLSGVSLDNDVLLNPEDRIFIPPLRFSIYVTGGVFTPRAVPYFPGAPATYYIGLAGGVDPERSGGSYWLMDGNGKRKKPGSQVMPSDRIYVPLDGIRYNIERYMPLVTGTVALVVSITTFVWLVKDREYVERLQQLGP